MAKENKTILRQPKVYNPPDEKESFRLPKFIKVLAILVIIFLGLIYLLFLSPVFTIKKIIIEGSPSDEIKTKTEELKSKNIFLFKSNSTQDSLIANHSEIISVKIYRGLPSTLRIVFVSRLGEIVWQSEDRNFLVDSDGFAFKEISTPSDLPLIKDNKNLAVKIPMTVASSGFVKFVQEAIPKIKDLNIKVDHFEINETTFQLDAITDKNIKIDFDTVRPLAEQIEALQKVYVEHKDEITEYVDVRVEGWVYYK